MILIVELCICAAWKDTTGYIWRGHRHDKCYKAMAECDPPRIPSREPDAQGFVTSANRFVDRHEGADLMRTARHISADTGQLFTSGTLFSEDLY